MYGVVCVSVCVSARDACVACVECERECVFVCCVCCICSVLVVYGSYDCCRNSVSMCVWNYFLSILRHVRHPRSIIDSIRDQTESFEILKQALALQYAHASLSLPLSLSLCAISYIPDQ